MELTDFLIDKIEEISFTKVDSSQELISSGILDSVNVVEFAVEIERHFKINIPLEDINAENFESVEILSNYLKLKFGL